MVLTARRVPLGLLTSSMLLFGACSSGDTPETLPLIQDAPAAPAESSTTTIDEGVEPGVEAELAALSAEQQALLDGCAGALDSAVGSVDRSSPTYSDEVTAILLDPASDVMATCGPLFDSSTGIDQGVIISFMIETLPPELLGTLGALSTGIGPDGTPTMPDSASDDSASDDSASDDTTTDDTATDSADTLD